MTRGNATIDEGPADRTVWGRFTESAAGAHILNAVPASVGVKSWRSQHCHMIVEVGAVPQCRAHLVDGELRIGTPGSPLGVLDESSHRFNTQAILSQAILVGRPDETPLDESLSRPIRE